jgi:hypothetical protein
MKKTRTFSKPVLATVDASRIIGIRAGREHRFIGIWVVVLEGRVFVRPWNNKPQGWYRAFQEDPRGAIHVPPDREIRVRTKPARGERLFDQIDRAYAAKYPTPGSRQYVIGFAKPKRRKTTTELLPA